MARQYQLKSFLRSAPNELLRRYLADHNIGADIDWDSIKETQIGPIVEALADAPESVRCQVETDFRDIEAMATDGGAQTLLEEAEFHGRKAEFSRAFGATQSDHERALWAFLEHWDVFDVARRFNYADNLPQRSWRKRADLPEAKAETDLKSRKRLAEAISFYYREKEGRGHACHIDHYLREKRLYWFAYPEDWARTTVGYDDKGQFRTWTQRPAFEVIFVHCPEERSLDLFVTATKHTVWDLQRIFGREILGVDLHDPEEEPPTYDLSGLLDADFSFPHDPADGIQDVRVRKLRLSLLGGGNRRITLEANVRNHPKAVYELLDDVLAGGRIPRGVINVMHAGLQIVFRPDESGRATTLSFYISYPNSLSLKYDPKDLIARKYLKEWGIDISDRTQRRSQSRRGRAQYLLPVD